MIPNANNFKFGSTAVKKLYQGSTLVWPTPPPVIDNNTIVYTSTDSSIVIPKPSSSGQNPPFGQANIISNTYTGNTGIITCDRDITLIEDEAFWGCSTLQTIIIPNTVTTIGRGTFYSCSNLISAILPNALTDIGQGAFQYCSHLQSATLPTSVTTIHYAAFQGCSSLQFIVIPSSVTSIGQHAFSWCTNLQSATVLAVTPPTAIDEVVHVSDRHWWEAFYNSNWPPGTSIYVPTQSVNAYKIADGWSEYADKIQAIPS